jgi:hypothetical protein
MLGGGDREAPAPRFAIDAEEQGIRRGQADALELFPRKPSDRGLGPLRIRANHGLLVGKNKKFGLRRGAKLLEMGRVAALVALAVEKRRRSERGFHGLPPTGAREHSGNLPRNAVLGKLCMPVYSL